MTLLIGVDEAGYGPNYGPLVIAATAWQVEVKGEGGRGKAEGGRSGTSTSTKRAVASPPTTPKTASTAPRWPDLYQLLRTAVVRSPQECARRIAIADSKQLYKPGAGVQQLERGVLAALLSLSANRRDCVAHVAELLAATAADPHERRRELDCHADDEQRLPFEAVAEEICQLAALLRTACASSGARLIAIRARLIFPAEFNDLIDRYGTKGAALSHLTLELVRRVVDEATRAGGEDAPARSPIPTAHCPLPAAHSPLPTSIALDKHGGRNRYAALLQHHFPESWIETIAEGRAASRYQWTHREAPVEAIFRVGCEELLPTALASMTAKYHRELAMRAFNNFWTARLPGLKPTAGYPLDAKRFRTAITPLQQELGIDDRLIWRSR